MMNAEGTRTTQAPTTDKAAQAMLIARLSNEHLLNLRKAIDALYRNLDSSYWYSTSSKMKAERDGLLKEIKELKDALEEEYATRLFRGYSAQFQKLIADLQPQQQSAGRKLIPINANVSQEAGQQDEQQPHQENTLQKAADLAEQLLAMLSQTTTTTEKTTEEEG